MMAIRFKRMFDDAILPFRADPGSAGYDLSSPVDAIVQPHSMEFIKSGWAVEIPKGFFGAIYARSGLATHHHVRLANDVGIIDSSYRGQIGLPMFNDGDYPYIIHKGDRIAQLIVQPYLEFDIKVVDELGQTERGSSGLGSSGR
jgi:dUTP pyrophosphatase